MKYGKWFLPGLAACFCAFGDGAGTSPLIRIHADRNAGRAPEMIYGQNIEAADMRGISASLNNPVLSAIVNNASGYWDASNNRPAPIALETIKQLRCRMLRYPGGCLAHNYDWRKTVGPLEQRPQWKFGLDEFLRLCRETGAEPLITLTDYLLPAEDLPQHLAELVEYLNAPARPEFPQAMKRAANGHPEPYGVKYFEIGNETYHPNHNLLPARRFSVRQYIRYARNVIKALRSVDPSVRLGVVGYGLGLGEEPNPWDGAIYRELGNEADFIVHHLYVPKLDGLSPREAEAVIATSGEVIRQRLLNCRRHMRKLAGRELPIAVTEFNASSIRNAPHAWRFSYAAGINLCEFLMEMRKPEHNILMASYWQTVGGYFGMLQVDKSGGGKFNAVWPFFRAFTEYTAPDLLETEILNNPRGNFKAAKAGQVSAGGDRFIPSRKLGAVRKLYFYFSELGKANVSGEGDLRRLSFRFRNCSRNSYPCFLTIPVPEEVKGGSFSVNAEFEARFIPDSGSSGSVSLGFGLMDSRGYAATRLAQAVSGLEKAGEWTRFSCPALGVGPDTPSLTGLLRLEKVTGEFSGTLEIRNLQFTCSGEATVPAVPRLAAEASRRDGTVCLAVINRSPEAMRGVRIELAGMGAGENVGKVRELYRTNIAETEPFPITEKELPILKENTFAWDFPPFSATFFEFKKKRQSDGKP